MQHKRISFECNKVNVRVHCPCDLLNIISYLTAFRYTESELLELLNLERSTFYDRKKEAVLLLGISLWGYAIPVFRGIFDAEGDESEIPEFFTNTEKSDLCPTKIRPISY